MDTDRSDRHRWSIPAAGQDLEACARQVELHVFDGHARVVIDGRATTHRRREDGALVFAVGRRGAELIPDGLGGFELRVGGRPQPSIDSLPPAALAPVEEATPRLRLPGAWVVALVVLAVTFGLRLRPLLARAPAWQPEFREVVSEGGRFSVELPAAPAEAVLHQPLLGVPRTIHVVRAELPRTATFAVGWLDLGETALDEATVARLCQEAVVAFVDEARLSRGSTAHVVVHERVVTTAPTPSCRLGGTLRRPFRLLDLVTGDAALFVDDAQVSARGEVRGGRLYVALAVVTKEHASRPDVARFFATFHALPGDA
ncbi:MAG: hypothetical protein JNL79_12075 [Myxococcales bacterium]|nr:hypothetical protein [Myxococcales bacterium]